jgi:WD40 repeat protein
MICNKNLLCVVALTIIGSLLGCAGVSPASRIETTVFLTVTYTLAPPTSTLPPTPAPTFTPTVAPTATPRSEPISSRNAKSLTDLAVIQGGALQMVFSSDGSHLIVTGRETLDSWVVQVWDLGTLELVNQLDISANQPEEADIRISADGLRIISYGGDESIRVQEPITGNLESEQFIGNPPVYSIGGSFSLDGLRLAIQQDENTLEIWDILQGSSRATIEFDSFISQLTFNQDGSLLAIKSHDDLYIFDTNTGQQISKFVEAGVTEATFSPDSLYYASGGMVGTIYERVAQIQLREIKTGKTVMDWNGGSSSNNRGSQGIRFSPDGKMIAIAFRYGSNQNFVDKIYLVDLKTGALKRTLEGVWVPNSNGMVFSKDNQFFAAARADGTIQLWDIEKGTVLASMKGHAPEVDSILFSPDGTLIAAIGSDGTVRLWGLPTSNITIARYGIEVDDGFFNKMVPPDWLSKGAVPARYQIDFTSSEIYNLKSCPYTDNHTLYFQQYDESVTITDLEDNHIVAKQKFIGKHSLLTCPDGYTFNDMTAKELVGSPDPAEFKSWLKKIMVPLGFTP